MSYELSQPPPVPPVEPVYVATNHVLHLLLSLVTCGAWLVVWPFVAIANSNANATKRRVFQAQVNQYQHAVWAREQAEQRMREAGLGDPRAGYRPAAGNPYRQPQREADEVGP